MRWSSYIMMVLALALAVTGCQSYKIPDNIPMSSPQAGYLPQVEILDAYCLESQSSSFPFRFTLKNLQNEDINIDYYWTLNDPKADRSDALRNIHNPAARMYQGHDKLSLSASEAREIRLAIKESREYDPRFYVMYISVLRDNTQVGYYRGQKSTNNFDYNHTPPVPLDKNPTQ